MASEIRLKAHELTQYILDTRRKLHRHPELGMQEFWTTDFIAAELDSMGIPYRRIEPTGIIADLEGAYPGKTVALRADIDALNVEEKTGLSYASEIPGMMHACGHDVHIAMLLAAAKILAEKSKELHGNIRFIFQPAEEDMLGAKEVIRQGGLENVDAMFGMHTIGPLPPSVILLSEGPIQAGNLYFKITVHGKTTHAAQPEEGMDASLAAGALLMNLQSIVSRELSPKEPSVVTVGKVTSGTRFNVISEEAVLEGTCRYYDRGIQAALPGIIERIAVKTAETYRCTASVECKSLCEVNVNDNDMTAIMRAAARKISDSEDMVMPMPRVMGSEDFAEYAALCPSAYADLGAGSDYANHSNYFYSQDDTLEVGVALYAQTAIDFLNQ